MSSQRISAADRMKAHSVAEREILKYKGNHALWHKHVHNTELDAVQVLKMDQMDRELYTIDYSCRRTGKTVAKELYFLEFLACNADQELGIVAPRLAQSQTNLRYHTEAIRLRSPILKAYIDYVSGRRALSDTKYQFANRSKAEAHGVMSQIDGSDMTAMSLEEYDDMPAERLKNNFLLTLGAARKLGASKTSLNKPQVRITGVFKGADALTDLLNTGGYTVIGALHGAAARTAIQKLIDRGKVPRDAVELESYNYPLPIANMPNAIDLELVQGPFLTKLADEMSEDEVIRQLYCINTSSRNLVWELYLRKALQKGLMVNFQIVQPMPGGQYRKRGRISFGYDHLGHGEQPESSKSCLVVLEQVDVWTALRFVKFWPPGTDEGVIKRDLKSYWRYFNPDGAIGDAYGIGMLTTLNEELFNEGLTTINRLTIGDGQSTASTWSEWAFSPMRFEGMTKHSMATLVRSLFHDERMVMPYFDDQDMAPDAELAELRMLARQVINIRADVTKAGYASYKMVNGKIGDDGFDALMAAVWSLTMRGETIQTAILLGKTTREKLLERQNAA